MAQLTIRNLDPQIVSTLKTKVELHGHSFEQELLGLVHPIAPLSERALEIAAELSHPVYDCFYLALAEAEGARMVTADRRLVAVLRGTPWADACRPLVG